MTTEEVYKDKVELKVSAQRLWKAAFEDAHSVLPRATPEVVARVEYEGSQLGVGCIRTIHFQKSYAEMIAKDKHPSQIVLFTKEKVLELDTAALSVTIDIIEGGLIGVLVRRYKGIFGVEETGPHASIVHFTFEYEALSDAHRPHVPIALQQLIPRFFLSVEAFLLSHSDY